MRRKNRISCCEIVWNITVRVAGVVINSVTKGVTVTSESDSACHSRGADKRSLFIFTKRPNQGQRGTAQYNALCLSLAALGPASF
jgi:hypothetical protein